MQNQKRIYISGPMTGIEDNNFAAFLAAGDLFRKDGWAIENPAEHPINSESATYAEYMRADIRMLLRCSAIALLENWEESLGATLEVAIAKTLELDFYCAETMKKIIHPWGTFIGC